MLIFVAALMLVASVCIGIVAFLLTNKSAKDAFYFIALCLYIAIYAYGNAMLYMADSMPAVISALVVENIGIPAITPFFLLSILQLCKPEALRPWMGFAGFAYACMYALIVFFNEYHHLYYSFYEVDFGGAFAQVSLGKGPLYIINQVVVIICFALAYSVLIRQFLSWGRKMRRQMSLIIVGSAVALAGNVINVLSLLPVRMDVAIYACGLAAVFFFICILSNRLYDLVPLASKLAVETMDDAMIVLSRDASCLFSNDAALEIFPGLRALTPATPIFRMPGWPDALKGRLAAGQVNITIPAESGAIRSFRAAISPIARQNGDLLGWSILMRDTTDMVDLMEQLQKLAVTDSLTGLYNRRHFVQMAQTEQKNAAFKPQKLSMIMFDIDHFKAINDNYGHAAGDAVLVAVSDAVHAVLRGTDTLSRYGGEEFTILSTNTDIHGAKVFAERLRRVIENLHIVYEGQTIRVKASFGVSEFEPEGDIESAIEAADHAMYTAKSTGRNRVVAACETLSALPSQAES